MRMPEGEALRRAVRWISQERETGRERPLAALVDEASLRFDLSPKDGAFLLEFFREAERRGGAGGEGTEPGGGAAGGEGTEPGGGA